MIKICIAWLNGRAGFATVKGRVITINKIATSCNKLGKLM